MFRTFGFLKRRADMDAQQFRDYYEHNHAPLILSVAPAPPVYRRHYVTGRSGPWPNTAELQYDVITEIAFHDRDSYLEWVALLPREAIEADEAEFLDPSTRKPHRVVFMDETV